MMQLVPPLNASNSGDAAAGKQATMKEMRSNKGVFNSHKEQCRPVGLKEGRWMDAGT